MFKSSDIIQTKIIRYISLKVLVNEYAFIIYIQS